MQKKLVLDTESQWNNFDGIEKAMPARDKEHEFAIISVTLIDILRDANLRSDIEGYRDVCRLPLRCSVLLSPLLLNCSRLLIRLILDDVDGSLVAEISWKISI